MGNCHTVGPNEALVVSGELRVCLDVVFFFFSAIYPPRSVNTDTSETTYGFHITYSLKSFSSSRNMTIIVFLTKQKLAIRVSLQQKYVIIIYTVRSANKRRSNSTERDNISVKPTFI